MYLHKYYAINRASYSIETGNFRNDRNIGTISFVTPESVQTEILALFRYERKSANISVNTKIAGHYPICITATALLTGGAPLQMCPIAYVGLRTEATSRGVYSFGWI